MENLGIDLRLIITQIINFSLLLFLLSKFLYKPILKVLDERKKKIAESLTTAQKIEEEKIKLEEKKEAELKKAKELGSEIIAQMRSAGEQEREGIVKSAQEEAERILERAKEQLSLEREKLQEEMKGELVSLSMLIAEKILKEKIGKKEVEVLKSLEPLKKEASVAFIKSVSSFKRKKVSLQASKITEGFLTLLKKTQKINLLPEIVQNLEEGLVARAEVMTASQLDQEGKRKAILTLEEIFGEGVQVRFLVDPKIVGGMIVKVGDQVFDNSLLGKARQLKESL